MNPMPGELARTFEDAPRRHVAYPKPHETAYGCAETAVTAIDDNQLCEMPSPRSFAMPVWNERRLLRCGCFDDRAADAVFFVTARPVLAAMATGFETASLDVVARASDGLVAEIATA
jgi:hypothetical protein